MAKQVLFDENGWELWKEGDLFHIRYTPPGRFGDKYEGSGNCAEAAYLSLQANVRKLPAAEKFLATAREKGVIAPEQK